MKKATCPNCGEKTAITGNLFLGRSVTCSLCGEESDLINLDPLQLDWPLDDYAEDELSYSEYDSYND